MHDASPRGTPFTIENLPYGVISTAADPKRRAATALDDSAVDLNVLQTQGVFDNISGLPVGIFAADDLNGFAALPPSVRLALRRRLIQALSKPSRHDVHVAAAFIPLSDVTNHYPMKTSNFSDFYCSLEHTRNCTELFNKKSIDANWFIAPSVYNGRTSSLVVSGTPITRPYGVIQPSSADDNAGCYFGSTGALDFELEMGVFLSTPVARGRRVDIGEAAQHVFGFVLLNDWSSRDIQAFEMAPLGPFHSKGSATSISPWIVVPEALEVVLGPRKTAQEPKPLPHLDWADRERATFDIELSVKIIRDGQSFLLGQSNLNELHWTPFQQLTHLASAGEGLATGDLFGTGTISSDRTDGNGEKVGLGCILERKLARNSLSALPDVAQTFLKDGDEVVMEAWCRSRTTGRFFGFGQCSGVVLPPYES
ncbi:fumarylacetoacetate hydrolase [Coniochaeta sp. 2T2.1]|nr:fumarylacetoacetate hydrolase [Coniochaeta sp. 2T2.1]